MILFLLALLMQTPHKKCVDGPPPNDGNIYKHVETTPGCWQWKEDKAAEREIVRKETDEYNQYEEHIMDLWNALNTRLLTDRELDEAIKLGSQINTAFTCYAYTTGCAGPSYNENEKQEERHNAFLFQYRLRFEYEKAMGKKP